MNAPETQPGDMPESPERPASTLIVIQADDADFCAADGTGC